MDMALRFTRSGARWYARNYRTCHTSRQAQRTFASPITRLNICFLVQKGVISTLTDKGMDVRNNFKEWCNKVSEQEYNELQKAKRNAEYLAKLDRSFEQLERGEVIVKSMEELETMVNE